MQQVNHFVQNLMGTHWSLTDLSELSTASRQTIKEVLKTCIKTTGKPFLGETLKRTHGLRERFHDRSWEEGLGKFLTLRVEGQSIQTANNRMAPAFLQTFYDLQEANPLLAAPQPVNELASFEHVPEHIRNQNSFLEYHVEPLQKIYKTFAVNDRSNNELAESIQHIMLETHNQFMTHLRFNLPELKLPEALQVALAHGALDNALNQADPEFVDGFLYNHEGLKGPRAILYLKLLHQNLQNAGLDQSILNNYLFQTPNWAQFMRYLLHHTTPIEEKVRLVQVIAQRTLDSSPDHSTKVNTLYDFYSSAVIEFGEEGIDFVTTVLNALG